MREREIPEYVYDCTTLLCESYNDLTERLEWLEHAPGGIYAGDPDRLIRVKDVVRRQRDAMERALDKLGPDGRRIVIENLFDGIPIQKIDTDYSIPQRKHIRYMYVLKVAQYLGEI